MASTILVHSSASVMDIGLTRRYTYQRFSWMSTCNPSQYSWPRTKSGGGHFKRASSSNDLTIGGATAFPSYRNSPNSSASSLCSIDSLSSLPDTGLLRAGDPFSGRSDSAKPRAADICPFMFLEPSTWLTNLSEVKGKRPVPAFSESSCTLEGVCAVMGPPPFAVRSTHPRSLCSCPIWLRPSLSFSPTFSSLMPSDLHISFSDFSVSQRKLAFLSAIYQSLEGDFTFLSENGLTTVLPPDAKLLWSYSTPSRSLTAVVSLEGDQARLDE